MKDANIPLPVDKRILASIGEDSAVIKISEEVALVKSIDIFTPLVDDGYLQGEITACNVTNDIYAMGVTDITGILVFEAFPYEMPHEIAVNLLKGFYDFANRLNAPVVGGHTIINPWPLLGGCAIGISHPAKITYSSGAKPGDTLLLTKPLGIQPAMAVYRLLRDPQESVEELFPNLSHQALENLPELAIKAMTISNKPVAEVIREIPIHAATDVTGFGIAGHAQVIAERSQVNITIERLPIFKNSLEVSGILGYGLKAGKSAETAGGMLLVVSPGKLDSIRMALQKKRIPAFEVGKVTRGKGT
ncbi:MAG: selenide, water dikinase SelD, partial [Candidatus Helarchaeota archaeon]|nr:selenide, water dikinase SelD [Candidatus Helarchaeota archaeon]